MSFEAILFDLDGTLLDHHGAATRAVEQWSHNLGIPADLERWFELENHWFALYEQGEISHQEHRRARVRDYLGDALETEDVDAIYQHFLELYVAGTSAYPDALPALRRALDTGAKVAILTNGKQDLQAEKMQVAGLDLPGIQLLSSEKLGAAKPSTDAYSKALEILAVPADRAIMIGDNYLNDIEAAAAAGVAARHLDRSAGDTLAAYPPPMPRMVVCDMDGTLLDAEGRIPAGFPDIFEQMQQRDITFVPASGRQYPTLQGMFPECRTFIAENGNVLVRDGEIIHTTALPENVVQNVVHAVRNSGIPSDSYGLVLCGADRAYVENSNPDFLREVDKYYASREIVYDLATINAPLVKIALYLFSDTEEFRIPELGEGMIAAISGKHWIDFMSTEMNKGIALQKLREAAGIGTEVVAVFGDYLNDYQMMSEGKLSFAMAGAHPELKSVAKWQAPSNEVGGVISVVRGLVG